MESVQHDDFGRQHLRGPHAGPQKEIHLLCQERYCCCPLICRAAVFSVEQEVLTRPSLRQKNDSGPAIFSGNFTLVTPVVSVSHPQFFLCSDELFRLPMSCSASTPQFFLCAGLEPGLRRRYRRNFGSEGTPDRKNKVRAYQLVPFVLFLQPICTCSEPPNLATSRTKPSPRRVLDHRRQCRPDARRLAPARPALVKPRRCEGAVRIPRP